MVLHLLWRSQRGWLLVLNVALLAGLGACSSTASKVGGDTDPGGAAGAAARGGTSGGGGKGGGGGAAGNLAGSSGTSMGGAVAIGGAAGSGGESGSVCSPGAACTGSDPCKTATISCSSGNPVCVDSGSLGDSTSCGANRVCIGGVCTNQLALGASCSIGYQCISGYCVDGYCCGSASCPICQNCGTNGSCTTLPNYSDDLSPPPGTATCYGGNNTVCHKGSCSTCGHIAGYPCCSGYVCPEAGLGCNGSTNYCSSCGDPGNACCTLGQACQTNGTLHCSNRLCVF